jgi:tRNA A-37 threonylcarbamoyl transferase component Bud32
MGANNQFTVPKPYLLDEEHGLLMREWIVGTNLTDLVFSLRCSRSVAEGYMTRAGRWLRAFHEAGRLPPSKLNIDAALATVDELSSSELVDDAVFTNALRCIRNTANIVAARDYESSWIHGDFKTDNVIVSGARTIGLDLHQRMENCVLFDLGPFLNHLELNLWRPSALRWCTAINRLSHTFLTAYQMTNDSTTRMALNWVRVLPMLSLWMRTADRHRGRVSAPFVRAVFRAAVRRIAYQLKGGPD